MAEKLFTEFPRISTQEWKEKIIKDLKGADYDKKLVWRTDENFNVSPFYRSEDIENLASTQLKAGEYPYIRSSKKTDNSWQIRQDIEVKDIDKANTEALDALMKGANSLGFILMQQTISSQKDFSRLLRGIQLDVVELNFIGPYASDYLSMLYNEAKAKGIDSSKLYGSIKYNPLAFTLCHGYEMDSDFKSSIKKLQKLVEFATEHLPNVHVIVIEGSKIHNAGSSITQELGFSLAQANEYLSHGNEKGLNLQSLAKSMRLKLAVSSNYFMEIAKFRAARLLWSKILEAWNIEGYQEIPAYIHAETSRWNMTVYDAYVNMLRNTTEAMSAVLAGVDSLSVMPFNKAFGEQDEFNQRISRNLQNILKEEAYFDKIIDPAAGSYYIETLTKEIAKKAWQYFLEVEEKGGFYKAIKEGYIQEQVNENAQKMDMKLSQGRISLLGTNKYPNPQEQISDLGKKISPSNTNDGYKKTIKTLKAYRGAIAFEELRQKVDKMENRPKVFLFNFGNVTMRKARATFAQNFFGCAGFEIIDNDGFDKIEQGIEEIKKHKPKIVVACSSDDKYRDFTPELLSQLPKDIKLIIAGNPSSKEELEKAGIKQFIHVKSNILEKLTQFVNELSTMST